MNISKNLEKKRIINKQLLILVLLFIATFFSIYFFINFQKVTSFDFDSGQYWDLSFLFTDEYNNFSFINYYHNLRGYAFPFMLYIIRLISDSLKIDNFLFFNLFSSLVFSIFTCIVVPLYFEKIFNFKFHLISRLLIIVIFFYFWRGSFVYPLSDFTALFILLIGISLTKKIYENKHTYQKLISSFFSGIFLYMSYNIRTIYIVVIITVFFFLCLYKKIIIKKRIFVMIFFIFGILVMATPQILINNYNNNGPTPLIKTTYQGKDFNLYALDDGISVQKYETNINYNSYPIPNVVFLDKEGEQIKTSINNYSDYFKLILKNPKTFITIYFRHFFNGIDIYYPDIYVKDIFQNRTIFTLVNYTFWFIFFYFLYLNFLNIISLQAENKFMILILIIPIIFTLPIHSEPRYYLPFFVLCYGFICYIINIKINLIFNLKDKTYHIKYFFKKNYTQILKVLLLYIIFLIVCYTLSANTFSSLAIK